MAISASDFHADDNDTPTDLATEIDGLMAQVSTNSPPDPVANSEKSTHSAWPDARLRSEISGSSRDTGYRRLRVLFPSGKSLTRRAPSMVSWR